MYKIEEIDFFIGKVEVDVFEDFWVKLVLKNFIEKVSCFVR